MWTASIFRRKWCTYDMLWYDIWHHTCMICDATHLHPYPCPRNKTVICMIYETLNLFSEYYVFQMLKRSHCLVVWGWCVSGKIKRGCLAPANLTLQGLNKIADIVQMTCLNCIFLKKISISLFNFNWNLSRVDFSLKYQLRRRQYSLCCSQ